MTTTYTYNRLNLLTGSSNGASTAAMTYDSSGRLVSYNAGGSVTQMAYAGANLVLERNAAGTLLRRYVFGPGSDNPVVWYEGPGTTQRRWLQGDERGSVVAVSDSGGASVAINRYDEYGIPQGNTGRFQYTGQTWYGELGLYNYKARWYSPSLGRFMQTDPIGYKDQINLYAYVGNDPVNKADPSGKYACEGTRDFCNKVAGGVSRLRHAEQDARGSGPPTRESRLLHASAMALGTQGDRNGVKIMSGDLKEGVGAQTSGSRITIDQANVESGTSFLGEKWDRFGEILSHEGAHLWYHSSYGGIDGKLDDERAGYRTEFIMNRFLTRENPLLQPFNSISGTSERNFVKDNSIYGCSKDYSEAQCFDSSIGFKW